MPNDPAPLGPTMEELKAEIADLKKQLAGMVPGAEKTKLESELAAANAELAELKKKAAPPPPSPEPKDDRAERRGSWSDHFIH